MQTAAIIPARYASTRLPAKPLLDRSGFPMVVHVAQRASLAKRIDRVLVATDDERIRAAVEKHGFEAVMTRADHPNGSSRIHEAAQSLPESFGIVVNVQGDEPLIEPEAIDATVERLVHGDEPMSTVVSPFMPGEDPANPNLVKVVLDRNERAIYFSRSLIPFPRETGGGGPSYLKHAGLYAFRRGFLAIFASLPQTPAERSESLEQLRALENGYEIGVARSVIRSQGIDTPDQYEAFVRAYLASR